MKWSSENVRTYPDIGQYLKSSPGENERCKSAALEPTIECWPFPGSFHESLVWEFWSLINFYCSQLTSSPKTMRFSFWRIFFSQVGDIFVCVVFNQKSSKTTTPQPTVFHREAVGVAGQHRGGCPGEHWSNLWCGRFYQLRGGWENGWMDGVWWMDVWSQYLIVLKLIYFVICD